MQFLTYLIITGFGLAVGSFLNVLIYRLNVEKAPKFWQGRSICPKCKHQLLWRDNIPLVSFVVLGGRCRHCKRPIGWRYPLVEVISAVVTIFLWPSPSLLLLSYIFIVIFFSDLIYGLIPTEMIASGVLIAGITNYQLLITNLIPATLAAGAFLLVVLLTRFRGMGMGDVMLAFLMGWLLGWPKILVAFWSAFILGGGVAVILLLLKRTKLSATIALGPFLVVGIIVAALWSERILQLVFP